jgi:hypothetical protein
MTPSLLDPYQPFIHDIEWVFHNRRLRRELARLHPEDLPEFGFTMSDLDWQTYGIEVQYPGLVTWSLPLLRGETIPLDPPSEPPLVIASTPSLREAVQ